MTRSAAREIAIRLSFFAAARGRDTDELISAFFDREYYATLFPEDELFSKYPNKKQLAYITELVKGVASRRGELDAVIEKYSKGWKVKRISKTAAAVLRCCIFEILYMDEVPDAAAICEAVELSKNYDEPETTAFINGILGSVARKEL